MNAARSQPPEPAGPREAAELARRVADMLDRWTTEPPVDEPDWVVEQIAPVELRAPESSDEG